MEDHSEDQLLSVLNPNPCKLPGPELLHQLVFHPGEPTDGIGNNTSNTAATIWDSGQCPPSLDYQGPDGQRTILSYVQLHQTARVLAAEIDRKLARLPPTSATSGEAGGCNSGYVNSADAQPVIPVLIPQVPELYVALLAILKAGGAFCPIQLDAPPDRVRFILKDVAAKVVLTTADQAAKLPISTDIIGNGSGSAVCSVQMILVDTLLQPYFARIRSATETRAGTGTGTGTHAATGTSNGKAPMNIELDYTPQRAPSPHDLAYVMYTSGSTGTPKGVGVPHSAAAQSLLAHDRHIPAFARFLQFAAPTFDVSVFEIFFPWMRGATLVGCSRAELLNNLPAILCSLDIDACELTPTVAGSLLRRRENAPCLHLLLTIGEMLTEPVIREFGARGTHEPGILWALYGPTEAAIHCSLQPSLDVSASVRTIGFPLDTVSAYILSTQEDSDQDRPSGDVSVVPRGEVGELALGGYQLASGYINRPEQTAAAFISTKQYGRLYRTGDKARITEDGRLECYGRLSGGQVKLRGQRIELGEVEQAVLRTLGCLASVASVINGILVAFCHVGDALDGMEDKILKSCHSWLPRFMVPGDLVLMQDFPRLASGKVDRKRLSDEYAQLRKTALLSSTSRTHTAPYSDDLGHLLHDVAFDVLGHSLDSSMSLATAGLDSLQSIRMASCLRSAGIRRISAIEILDANTLSALQSYICLRQEEVEMEGRDTPSEHGTSSLLETSAVVACLPILQLTTPDITVELISECAPIQVSMLAETLTDSRAYCNWIEFEFPNQSDATKIEICFQLLTEKNEALRTGFVQYEGRFVQVIWKKLPSSRIQIVSSLNRDSFFDSDDAFLFPLNLQILRPPAQSHRDSGLRALLRIHHAVYDGWSIDLLRADLNRLLKGHDAIARPGFRHVAAHYHAITVDQHDIARQFWAQSLSGFQPCSLPELTQCIGTANGIHVRSTKVTGLDSTFLGTALQTTGFGAAVFFQAAFAWLWSAFVGVSDIVVGTVTSGRTIPVDGIEDIVGPCLQTVPVRVDLSRMRSVHDLFSTVQSANRSLLSHAFLPLADIKKTAGLRPGQPLYDTLFVYQESLFSRTTPQDLVQEVDHQDYLETGLVWEIEPFQDSGFHLRVTSHNDTFSEELIAIMTDEFVHLVNHIANHVNDDLCTLRSCFPSSLLSSHNTNFRSLSLHPDLATLVQNAAHKTPYSEAICFVSSIGEGALVESQSLTYQDLDHLANRIARYLQAHGAKPNDAVAIIMEKSLLIYAGILGILKAGCAYLPLLPSTPEARARLIVEQGDVQLCLTDTATAEDLISRLPVESLDIQTADLARFSAANVDHLPADPSRMAYIIFTSGSTGTPKGVCVTHLNMCSNIDVLSRIYPQQNAGAKLLQSCSQAFDVSVFEIFFAWANGMCLCSATNDVLFADLERAIRVLGISHLSMTPTVAALVDPSNTPSVEFLVTSGEPMTDKVSRMWSKQLFQGYGPSETTNICTVKKMAPGDNIRHLGFAFENTSSYVLYPDSCEAVPLGGVGELCFGGDQVAAGYLKMPSLTAEKFITHPSYGRLYRSGDIGRMLPNGSLMIIGRVDDQVKLRGQRIELREIDTVIQESGTLSDSVTMLIRREESSFQQLVSFVVPHGVPAPSSTICHPLSPSDDCLARIVWQVFQALKIRLPSYMIPASVVPISTIPVTPAGKTNKRLLGELYCNLPRDYLSGLAASSNDERDNDSTPWAENERQISRIVALVLQADIRSVNRWTPLLSLGLDSISAIRLSKAIQQDMHRHVSISIILKNPFVARLAHILDQSADNRQPELEVYSLDVFSPQFLAELQDNLHSRGLYLDKVLPCTPLQEAMLVTPKKGKSYVNRMLFRLHAHPDKIKFAWRQVTRQHDILHTCFATTDNGQHPVAQIVLRNVEPPWQEFEAMVGTDEGDVEHMERCLAAHIKSVVDPVDSFCLPVSFSLIHRPNDCFLSLVIHHAVYDGEAIARLVCEVEQLVHDRPLALATPLPFSSFLERSLVVPTETDAFWSNHLFSFRPTLFRKRDSDPSVSSKANITNVLCGFVEMPLSNMQKRSNKLGFSLLTTCQSIWASLLHVVADVEDVCFGNVYNGRSLSLEGIDTLVAPCFNTVPLRVRFSDLRSSKDLMMYLQALNPDMMRHQFTSLRRIQTRHIGGAHLFDTLLLMQRPSPPLDATIWTLERDDGEMDFTLVCELRPNPEMDRLEIQLHYDPLYLTETGAAIVLALFRWLTPALLRFSSSRVPSRQDLPTHLQTQLDSLNLQFDRSTHEESDDKDASHEAKDIVETWSTVESVVRAVFSRLSGVPEDAIKRETTIYRLGLDSIRAVQVASLLRKGGLHVSAVNVIEQPSCAGLAQFLLKQSGNLSNDSEPSAPASPTQTPPDCSLSPSSASSVGYDVAGFRMLVEPLLSACGIARSDIETVLPCTPLQFSLLAEFIRSNGQHYFNLISYRGENGNANADLLEAAWNAVVASTPMLRTGFVSTDGIEDIEASIPFAMVQYTFPTTAVGRTIGRWKQSEFDLEKWHLDATKQALDDLQLPPWQVAIVKHTSSPVVTCHLAIHHALYDAISLSTITESLVQYIASSGPVTVGDISPAFGARTTPPTELVVSDILHQCAMAISPSSGLAEQWKELAPSAIVNKFPVLTPLKVSPRTIGVLCVPSTKPVEVLLEAVSHSGFTLHAVLQAAWTRILSSYVGDSAVVFGTVLSGRNSETIANAVFPCLTTLPVVAVNDASNRVLVESLMDRGILLHKSQHLPLGQIHKWLGRSDAALFDTLLVYQQLYGPDSTQSVERSRHTSVHSQPLTVVGEKAVVEYPVSIEAIPQASGILDYQITYDNSVLPAAQATMMLEQLDAVVCQLAMQPDGQEDDLVAMHSRYFSAVPAATPGLSSPITLLHQFVEEKAERISAKPALQFVTSFDSAGCAISREWTYEVLNDRGNAVALLVSGHVQPGSNVAVCFEKCPEAFFAILGIIKAGCSFVALDPKAPSSRKAFILQDSEATLLLTDAASTKSLSALADATGVSVMGVDDVTLASHVLTGAEKQTLRERCAAVSGDSVCYCLYTSGTTGTPKGCAITHENAVQAILAFQELFRGHWDEDSRWLQFASFHFDVSVLEQYWTWSVGLVLVGAPRDLILEDLSGTISRLGITHIDLTPSLGRLLDPKDVPSLCRGVFITGGEPLKQEMLDAWGPTRAVHNFYGPTEATIGVTSYPQVPRNGRASNIGRQFPNVGTLVLRPGTATPVLRGAVGELCVSGKLVGKGYLNRDALTSECFPTLSVQDRALGTSHDERVYRTGDLVRLLHDGCFDFLGRADDQVKLRGQRLEIGEINHVIRQGMESDIADVATLVVRDAASKKDFLVAFVVASLIGSPTAIGEGAADLSCRVQAVCRQRLPGYMVPTYVVQLSAMPLSANNKADVKELKRLFQSLTPEERLATAGAAVTGRNLDTARTGTKAVADSSTAAVLLQEVLCKLKLLGDEEPLNQDSTVFDLGIDSISVLRLARALQRQGLPATPSLVLSHPRIGDLTTALKRQSKSKDGGAVLEARLLVDACQHRNCTSVCQALGVRPEQIEYIAPCSPLQQGMISRSASGKEHQKTYYNAFVFQLHSDTRTERLKRSWQDVVDRNAILRTRFVATTDGFVQVALRPADALLPWEEVELPPAPHGGSSSLDVYVNERREQWIAANQEPADAGSHNIRSPLRLLCATSGEESSLVLYIFHGLYDAVSLDLILDQVVSAYFSDGKNHALDKATTHTFQEALCHGPLQSYNDSRPFWETHLKGYAFKPFSSLTSDELSLLSTAQDTTDVTASRAFVFSSVDSLRTSLGVTHSALVLALWASVLQPIYHDSALAVGLVLSGRTIDGLASPETVVGPLFNTLPFRPPQDGRATWRSLAQACHSFNAATLHFQQVPLRNIQKWCSGGQPIFDTLFSFQLSQSSHSSERQEAAIWTPSNVEIRADYPLALEAVLDTCASPKVLRLLLVAKGSVADEAALNGLLDQFQVALEAMSTDVNQRITSNPVGPQHSNGALPDRDGADEHLRKPGLSSDRRPYFSWEGDAAVLRREIARLGGVPEETITEDTALLELGLDSVDAIKLSARLRHAGIRLTNSQLVRSQRISELVHVIETKVSGNHRRLSTPTGPDSRTSAVDALSSALKDYLVQTGRDMTRVEAILPPTPLQEGMVADMIQSGFTRYFNHDILGLAPRTDIARLKRALLHVVRDNPILRTVFFHIDSPVLEIAFCQAILDYESVAAELIQNHQPTASRSSGSDSDSALETIVHQANNRVKKAQGEAALFQLAFVQGISGQCDYLVISIAHALYDGWSLELFHRKVKDEYQRDSSDSSSVDPKQEHDFPSAPSAICKPAPLPYVHQLNRILQASGSDASDFWRNFLAGARPTLVHPLVRSQNASEGPSGQNKRVTRIEVTSSVSVDCLLAFSKAEAASTQVIGQACWASVLATLAGSLDVLFGVVLSGRDSDDSSDAVMFPTMNTVPVRVVLHGSIAELLQYMQANMGIVGEHQHFPLRKAQRVAALPREADSGRSAAGSSGGARGGALFNTLFIMQKRLKPVSPQQCQDDGAMITLLAQSVRSISDVEYPICVEMEIVPGVGNGRNGNGVVVWRTACDNAFVSEHDAAELLHKLDTVLGYFTRDVLSARDDGPVSTGESRHGSKKRGRSSRPVLCFEDGGVSICGMPACSIRLPDQKDAIRTKQTSRSPLQRSKQNQGDQRTVSDGATWSDTEKAIRSVLAAVSGISEQAIDRTGQTAYHLGLDSISGIKVSSLLKKTKNVSLGVRELLSAASVEDMASLAHRNQHNQHNDDQELAEGEVGGESAADLAGGLLDPVFAQDVALLAAGLDMADIECILPATAMQIHMVSVWQNSGGAVFFPALSYALSGFTGNRRDVFAAWKRLVAEFPMLRTMLLTTSSTQKSPLIQVVVRSEPAAATPLDKGTERSGRADEEVEEEMGVWPALPGPPGRSFAFLWASRDAASQRFQVGLKIHHALYDAVSLRCMMDRFAELCGIFGGTGTSRATPSLANPALVNPAWKQMMNQQVSWPAQQQQHSHQYAFWTRHLSQYIQCPASTASWPRSGPTTDVFHKTTAAAGRTSYFRPQVLRDVSRLRSTAMEHGLSLQSLFFAAYARCLCLSQGTAAAKQHALFGIYLANRVQNGHDGSDGLARYPTLCLVPLLVLAPIQGSLIDVARQIQRDIHSILSAPSSLPGPATAGLWQIQEWTGIQVHTFVNFLLPMEEKSLQTATESSAHDTGDSGVVLEEDTDNADGRPERVFAKQMYLPDSFVGLQGNPVRACYQDTMDVEVAIRGTKLDIGVFAPASMFSDDMADTLIARLAVTLDEITAAQGSLQTIV